MTESVKLRWYDLRRLQLTREYCAGTIAGLGLGIMLMGYADSYRACPGWTLEFILVWHSYRLAVRGSGVSCVKKERDSAIVS